MYVYQRPSHDFWRLYKRIYLYPLYVLIQRGLMARIKPLFYRVLIILRVLLSILEETMKRR